MTGSVRFGVVVGANGGWADCGAFDTVDGAAEYAELLAESWPLAILFEIAPDGRAAVYRRGEVRPEERRILPW